LLPPFGQLGIRQVPSLSYDVHERTTNDEGASNERVDHHEECVARTSISMRILVTGAAGFIGSTTAELLLARGHDVVALDNLYSGRRENVPTAAHFVHGDCGDGELIDSLGAFDACVHFAGRIEPGESMQFPEQYFDINVGSTFRLLNSLVRSGVERFVFSSSCAVYGNQVEMPIDEKRPTMPHSPYGQTKLMVEEGLQWLAERERIRSVSLRYFNAAGSTVAHPERHHPETHLIPIAMDAALGKRSHLNLFGSDYPTPDGTCVRDYIHVSDLAEAHALAIGALENYPTLTLNLGTGIGSSNLEVVAMVKNVTGEDFDVRFSERRAGDPAAAVASNRLAGDTLGWVPKCSDLETIVTHAWSTHQTL
jgi:UDP-glucose 4-epimerase